LSVLQFTATDYLFYIFKTFLRSVGPLEQVMQTPRRKQSFSFIYYCYVLSRESANTNFIVLGLEHTGVWTHYLPRSQFAITRFNYQLAYYGFI